MAKYLFVYHGGEDPKTEEEVARVLDDWGNWLGGMGAAVIDGGNPVGGPRGKAETPVAIEQAVVS